LDASSSTILACNINTYKIWKLTFFLILTTLTNALHNYYYPLHNIIVTLNFRIIIYFRIRKYITKGKYIPSPLCSPTTYVQSEKRCISSQWTLHLLPPHTQRTTWCNNTKTRTGVEGTWRNCEYRRNGITSEVHKVTNTNGRRRWALCSSSEHSAFLPPRMANSAGTTQWTSSCHQHPSCSKITQPLIQVHALCVFDFLLIFSHHLSISKTDFKILKFVKRNTNSISDKCEMEFEIRFKKKIGNFLKRITESVSHFFWNGIRIPFHKYFNFFVKRIMWFVSKCCETDSRMSFMKIPCFFFETECGINFILFETEGPPPTREWKNEAKKI